MLNGTNINGRNMDMGRIDEVVTVGDTEVWEVTNSSGTPHSFHVHDVQFRILDVDGRSPHRAPTRAQGHRLPTTGDDGPAGHAVHRLHRPEVAVHVHGHLPQHEDRGMMGQFAVVEPGRRAGQAPSHHHG